MRVVGAVVEGSGRFFMGRRPHHARHGGLWEFPGGKVEPGEDAVHALARELLEEFAAPVVVGPLVATGRDGDVQLDCFRVRFLAQPVPLHHAEVAWIPRAQLATLPTPPADQPAIRVLLGDVSGDGPQPGRASGSP